MNSKVLLSLIAVIIAVIAPALSLKCYNCDSTNDPECNNPSTAGVNVKICEPDEKYCRKVEQDINIDGDDTTRVFRSCAKTANPDYVNDECLERTGTYRFKSWYCECTGDLCNSATGSQVSVVAMSLSAAVGFLVKKLL